MTAPKCFCSWSGGKDSCLALHRAVRSGCEPIALLTMLVEDGKRSRSHGLSVEALEAQAAAVGVPLVTKATSWDAYESRFIEALGELSRDGATVGVFGDIDVEQHLEWVTRVCSKAGIEAQEPLWGSSRRDLLEEFLSAGFVARIVSVKDGVLEPSYLGRPIDADLVSEFERRGIDPSGENGEYHTVVVSGPMFASALRFDEGDRYMRDGYWFLDVSLSRDGGEA